MPRSPRYTKSTSEYLQPLTSFQPSIFGHDLGSIGLFVASFARGDTLGTCFQYLLALTLHNIASLSAWSEHGICTFAAG